VGSSQRREAEEPPLEKQPSSRVGGRKTLWAGINVKILREGV